MSKTPIVVTERHGIGGILNMPYYDCFILMGIGGLFGLLGLGAIIWGKVEERKYYDSLSSRTDVREYLNHWPPHPDIGAWKIGGWIALAIGLLLLVVGGVFCLLR